MTLSFYEAVYAVVRDIPPGQVMTYGQVATILGSPRAARAVGYALKACAAAEPPVPWQRVINHRGGISARGEVARPAEQRRLLEAEGILFREDDTCDLAMFRWLPPDPEQYALALSSDLPFR